MNRLLVSVTSAVLVALPAAAQGIESDLRLNYDRGKHALEIACAVEADVVLVVGHRAVPAIPVAGIRLDVLPEIVVYLGSFGGGEARSLDVPLGMVGIAAEAVALPAGSLRLVDSNVVGFGDDLVSATFDAQLRVALSSPPRYSVATFLVAPTTGHVYTLDAVERRGDVVDVYLTLEAPSATEGVLMILSEHAQVVELGSEVGRHVDVYLRRTERGASGHDTYERMVRLDIP
ncbi:MAG: hypothetical protein R3F56_08590 [Planctomycetota bacterium]